MKRHLAPTGLVLIVQLLAVAAFVPELYGQEKTDEAVWHRYSTSAGDLTFAFPGTDVLVDQDGTATWVAYAVNGITISVRADRTKNAKKLFLDGSSAYPPEKYDGFTLDDFYGRWYRDTDENKGRTAVFFQLASSKAIYFVNARARTDRLADLDRFLRSLRLGGKQLVNADIANEPESRNVIKLESLPTSEKVAAAIRRATPKELKFSRSLNTTSLPDDEMDLVVSPTFSRPLVILRKPRPRYTKASRERNDSGTVIFRVTFKADGTLGPVELLQSAGNELDKAAFEAVKGLRFIPAEIDEKPADIARTIEYSFQILDYFN